MADNNTTALAADAAYQRFRAVLTTLPPWSIWQDKGDGACDGPIHVRLTKEVAADHKERGVFPALWDHSFSDWSLSIPLAEALLADAEARLRTLDLQQYSPTVGRRMVKAYETLAMKVRKNLAEVRHV